MSWLLALLYWGFFHAQAAPVCPGGSTILSIQLKWLQQTQFAGYFVAQENGYFDDECLIVNLRPGGPAIIVEDEVLEGRAQFGVHWSVMTFSALNATKNVTIVAQIFQHPAMTMVSWRHDNMNSVKDYVNKRVCVWLGGNEGNLRAAFVSANMTWDEDSRAGSRWPTNASADIIAEGFSMEGFLNDDCDVAAATTYNEFAQVLEYEKPDGTLVGEDELNVLHFQKALLEDSIIASTEWLALPENRELTVRFLRACFRGWIWAKDHPEETVKLFADKSAHQIWQINEVNRLIWPSPFGIGIVNESTLQESADIAFEFGLTDRRWNVEEFYRSDLSAAAHIGLEMLDLVGADFVARHLSFCLGETGVEICKFETESTDSILAIDSAGGVVLFIVTTLAIIFVLVCLFLVRHWRAMRPIKASSVPFCVLMCIGALIGLSSNYFLLGRPTDAVCHARIWVLAIGFITFLGNFLLKVWRIYTIFTQKLLMKVIISDASLLVSFCLLLAVQVLLLGLYSGLDPPTVTKVPHTTNYAIYDTVCVHNKPQTWPMLFGIYAGILLVYGVYLALRIRNVRSEFNEAKVLGGSLYNIGLIFVVCGCIVEFVKLPPISAYLVQALGAIALFAGSLAIVFIPKFLAITSGHVTEIAPKEKEPTRGSGGSSNSGLHSTLIDVDSLAQLDTAYLESQKHQFLKLVKAIEVELEKRQPSGLSSKSSMHNSADFGQQQRSFS